MAASAAADVAEVRKLLAIALRPRVQEHLKAQLAVLEKEAAAEKAAAGEAAKASTDSGAPAAAPSIAYATLSEYAYDQTSTAVKVYVTLAGADGAEKVECKFEPGTFDLTVCGLAKKNYRLRPLGLHSAIVPGKCSHKVKKDMIVITLSKAESGHWSSLLVPAATTLDSPPCPSLSTKPKKGGTKEPGKKDEAKDPNDSIMSMMKDLYEDGDDEMKKVIAKAFTESREGKKSSLDDI